MKALQAENELLEQFTTELARSSEFYLGMALVTKSGLERVLSSIERCLERQGQGQVLFGIDLPTDPDAIQSLCGPGIRAISRFDDFNPAGVFSTPRFQFLSAAVGQKPPSSGLQT
jgi:hypothetical protein